MIVNWCQLEKGSVATPWTLAEGELTINNNLLPDDLAELKASGSSSCTVELIKDGCALNDGTTYDCIHSKNNGTSYADAIKLPTDININDKNTYTLSFYAKGTEMTSFLYPEAVQGLINADGSHYYSMVSPTSSMDGSSTTSLTSDWKHYQITWSSLPNNGNGKKLIVCRLNANQEAYVAGVKLEIGGRATYCQKFSEKTISKISQTANNIKAEVYNDLNVKTGIDISNGKIETTADKFIVKNSDGTQSIGVDDGGNMVVSGTIKSKNFYHNIDIITADSENVSSNNNLTNINRSSSTADVLLISGDFGTSTTFYDGMAYRVARPTYINLPNANNETYRGKTIRIINNAWAKYMGTTTNSYYFSSNVYVQCDGGGAIYDLELSFGGNTLRPYWTSLNMNQQKIESMTLLSAPFDGTSSNIDLFSWVIIDKTYSPNSSVRELKELM